MSYFCKPLSLLPHPSPQTPIFPFAVVERWEVYVFSIQPMSWQTFVELILCAQDVPDSRCFHEIQTFSCVAPIWWKIQTLKEAMMMLGCVEREHQGRASNETLECASPSEKGLPSRGEEFPRWKWGKEDSMSQGTSEGKLWVCVCMCVRICVHVHVCVSARMSVVGVRREYTCCSG